MDTSKMKNMVVLKNLPSNIIDEAIVILKPNKKIESLDYVENSKKSNKVEDVKSNSKDYIINEAQMIISNYISNVEGKKAKMNMNKIESKYKMLKTLTIVIGMLLIINSILKLI
jgi:hypothetical protein